MARHISRIAAVFDAAPIGVGVWSVRGELLHANPVLADLLGSDAASVRGRVFEEHLRADDVPGVRRMVGDLWDGTRNSFECDVRCVAPGGSDLWVRAYVTPVYGPAGGPEYLISQIFSFSRPGAEETATARLAHEPPVMLWLADERGIPRVGNRTTFEFLGLPPSSGELRRALFEDVDHDDVDPVRAEVRRAIDAHQPWTFTARSRRADDTWRWMRHDARPLHAADGACIGFAGVSVDVTDDQERRRELEEVQRLFSSVTDAGPIAVLRTDRAGNVTYANGRWAEILDDPATRLRETSWQSILVPEHVDELVRRSAQAVRLGRPFVMRVQAVEPLTGGSGPAHHWGELRVAPVYDDDGRHDGFVATLTDISAEVAADRRADRLAAVLDAGSDYLVIVDGDGAISHVNDAARAQLGVRPADEGPRDIDPTTAADRQRLRDVLDHDAVEVLETTVLPTLALDRIWRGELLLRDHAGGQIPVSALVLAQGDDRAPLESVAIVARDISDLKDVEHRMRELATHDYLTGLPNRILLYDRIEQALARQRRRGGPVALLYLDLDDFKPVNDDLGHHVGDAVLVVIADRITASLRGADTAARLGGDEFAVLVEGIGDDDGLDQVARRLIDAIGAPVEVDGRIIRTGVSIGIALVTGRGDDEHDRHDRHDARDGREDDAEHGVDRDRDRDLDVDHLVVAADRAMYAAKAAGGGCWRRS